MGIEGEGIDRSSIDENGYPKPAPTKDVPLIQSIVAFLFLGGVTYGSCYVVFKIATWFMS
jgi:hypothetical protein